MAKPIQIAITVIGSTELRQAEMQMVVLLDDGRIFTTDMAAGGGFNPKSWAEMEGPWDPDHQTKAEVAA